MFMMLRSYGLSLLLCLIMSSAAITASAADVSYDPTNDLYAAFGSKCKGFGSINSNAIRESTSLISIIKSIREDSTCAGISGALSEIESLKISELMAAQTAKHDNEQNWTQIHNVQLALDTELKLAKPDTTYIDSLKAELGTLKIAAAKSLTAGQSAQWTIRHKTIDTFQKASSALFSRLKNNDQCLVKRPNLATQIGAQVIGLGTTLSSGFAGALLLGLGNVIDDFMSFFRNKDLSDRDLRTHRLGEAVSCAIESLSATYCQARDVDTVIEYNSRALNQPGSSDSPNWLNAAGALSQDLDAYQVWITRIQAGTPATTAGQASDKSHAVDLQTDIRKLSIETDAILNMARTRVPKAQDPAQAKRSALEQIASHLARNSNISALFQEPACGPRIFILSGGDERTRVILPNEGCDTYLLRRFPNDGLPDLAGDITGALSQILIEGTSSVNVELSEVMESNAEAVIAAADSRVNGKSARHFLMSSQNYLVSLINDPDSIAQYQNQRILILKTQEQIRSALATLDRQTDVTNIDTKGWSKFIAPTQVDSVKKVSDLAQILIPSQDRLALPSALSQIINQDIDQRMSKNQIDEKLAILLKLSPRDNLSELVPNMLSIDSASQQIDSAQLLTRANLVTISNVFSDVIKSRLEGLSSGDLAQDTNAQRAKAMFCIQLLSVPQKINIDVASYCKGAFVKSRRESANIVVTFDENWNKPFPERVCATYDFHRKSYLYGLTQRPVYK